MYLFLNGKNDVIYVGKAKNLRNRVAQYFTKTINLEQKTSLLVSEIKKIKAVQVNSEIESLLLEANLIKKYSPYYNIKLTDGKSYPMIKITKDKSPKVLIVRKIDENQKTKGSLYFGPYPNTQSMYIVLKILRRIFPFQSVNNHAKRICLYNHLNLCPCPPMFKSKNEINQYRKSVRYIIRFLKGDIMNVTSDLEKERNEFSKNESYENAAEIQRKIDAINHITQKVYHPFEYEENPNLRVDLRNKELEDLKNNLQRNGVNVSQPSKIECFDISNTAGKLSVGSMVVFINAEKKTSLYRRFKINPKIEGPNDTSMIKSVISRRLKHPEWEYPDLIIVDGGKGQVGSAMKVLIEQGLNIPLIGLAKRNEIIITEEFREIILKRGSDGLNLIMRIRDEAHRFAITYHKTLRSKYLINPAS